MIALYVWVWMYTIGDIQMLSIYNNVQLGLYFNLVPLLIWHGVAKVGEMVCAMVAMRVCHKWGVDDMRK